MPLYEYQCAKCGMRFEVLLSFAEREQEEQKLTCPKCSADGPVRLLSTFATGDRLPAASSPAAASHTCTQRG